MNKLIDDVKTVIEAFEDGIFVRNTAEDHKPGWAVKLIDPLAALGRLKNAVENHTLRQEQNIERALQ